MTGVSFVSMPVFQMACQVRIVAFFFFFFPFLFVPVKDVKVIAVSNITERFLSNSINFPQSAFQVFKLSRI